MNLIPVKWKVAAYEKIGEISSKYLPEHILGRLSQLGAAPQYGNLVTLKDIQRAFENSRVGETYYMFALFRDMILNDPHMQAEIGKRIMSFIGQNETIEPFDKSNQDDVIAAEVIRDMITNCDNWREGCLHLGNGHVWPIAGCEKIFAPVTGSELYKFKHPVNYRLKKLSPIPYELFNYKVSFYNVNNIGGTPQQVLAPAPTLTNSGAIPLSTDSQFPTALNLKGMPTSDPNSLVWNPDDWNADLRFYNVLSNGLIDWTMSAAYKPDPERHVLHSANVATSSMKPNYGGLLGSLVFPWFLSMQGRDWFSRAMERYASPFAVAYANTANKNIFDLLTKAFNQATKVNALIVPPQAKIELKEVMVSGMADGYEKFIAMLNTEKTKAILGMTLSTTAKATGLGSGVADLQGEVRSDWMIYDQRSFADMEQKQIFEQYLRINGYKGRVPKVYRNGLSPVNQLTKAKTLLTLSQAGVFVDESAQDDLSKDFGTKLKVVDISKQATMTKPGEEKNKQET